MYLRRLSLLLLRLRALKSLSLSLSLRRSRLLQDTEQYKSRGQQGKAVQQLEQEGAM
jgi:hypothetical protein